MIVNKVVKKIIITQITRFKAIFSLTVLVYNTYSYFLEPQVNVGYGEKEEFLSHVQFQLLNLHNQGDTFMI